MLRQFQSAARVAPAARAAPAAAAERRSAWAAAEARFTSGSRAAAAGGRRAGAETNAGAGRCARSRAGWPEPLLPLRVVRPGHSWREETSALGASGASSGRWVRWQHQIQSFVKLGGHGVAAQQSPGTRAYPDRLRQRPGSSDTTRL